ncbi:hypothetical protein [Lentibacter sp. XHP0401]|jgi:hypothetical protein|uniref:hypothetical protein n=1 Tax=Lentibacter sp. XHP0401 TaxID=2984334 RepID=UPI0021E8E47E|nr:hypothetical protein [Lentibacter sp. XHP0401]MCV2893794.1 hypothetical protein [Lentibacter sp. XHP0401]
MLRFFLSLALTLSLSSIGPAEADPVTDAIAKAPYQYRAAIRNVLNSPVHAKALATCPADVFPRKGRYANGMTECGKNPDKCYKACISGDGNACFGLAHAFEKSRTDNSRRANYSDFTYTLFLASCQQGNANGCTNAAATSKNGTWIKEPPAKSRSIPCQYRTYKASCDANAYWGCSMLGGLHMRADAGQYRSAAKSKAAYEKARRLRKSGS